MDINPMLIISASMDGTDDGGNDGWTHRGGESPYVGG